MVSVVWPGTSHTASQLILSLEAVGSKVGDTALETRVGGQHHDEPESVAELSACVVAELSVFTDWLDDHNVKGVVGEFGWPSDAVDAWHQVAEDWLEAADEAGVGWLAWAVGPFDATHKEALYTRSRSWPEGGVDRPVDTGRILESRLDETAVIRGLAVTGGSWGDWKPGFSNSDPGTYGKDWFYETAPTFDYVASRGYNTVRIDFRWERLQPEIYGPLDHVELGRIQEAVANAGRAGLGTVLDLHNYGEYRTAGGTRNALGSPGLPTSALSDLWVRLSDVFAKDQRVVAYGLMNEPHDLGGAEDWERMSQEVLMALRRRGDSKLILVPGYGWSHAQVWSGNHEDPWIDDPIDNHLYEAHHYWDVEHGGNYGQTPPFRSERGCSTPTS